MPAETLTTEDPDSITQEPRRVSKNKFSSKFIILIAVLVALTVGFVLGVRFHGHFVGPQILIGAAFPSLNNNYMNALISRKIAIGMPKGEVLKHLKVRRVVVYAGEDLKKYDLKDIDPSLHLTEIWMIPNRTYGLSTYIYLGFDEKQRLCTYGGELRTYKGGSREWMLGYRANQEY